MHPSTPHRSAPTSARGPRSRRLLDKGTELAELLVAAFDQLRRRKLDKLVQMTFERRAQLGRGQCGVAVGATRGLGDDLVAYPELDEVGRGQLELGRRLADLRRIAPQDRRAALGRD